MWVKGSMGAEVNVVGGVGVVCLERLVVVGCPKMELLMMGRSGCYDKVGKLLVLASMNKSACVLHNSIVGHGLLPFVG